MSIASTLIKGTEFSGTSKLVAITATIATADDVIELTEATHGIKAITHVVGVNVLAPVAGFTDAGASSSGLTITLKAMEGDGTDATVFNRQVGVTVLGTI